MQYHIRGVSSFPGVQELFAVLDANWNSIPESGNAQILSECLESPLEISIQGKFSASSCIGGRSALGIAFITPPSSSSYIDVLVCHLGKGGEAFLVLVP